MVCAGFLLISRRAFVDMASPFAAVPVLEQALKTAAASSNVVARMNLGSVIVRGWNYRKLVALGTEKGGDGVWPLTLEN